jgi:hypothetical protein
LFLFLGSAFTARAPACSKCPKRAAQSLVYQDCQSMAWFVQLVSPDASCGLGESSPEPAAKAAARSRGRTFDRAGSAARSL